MSGGTWIKSSWRLVVVVMMLLLPPLIHAQNTPPRSDLIALKPFELQLALQSPVNENDNIEDVLNLNVLSNLVTDWLADSFATVAAANPPPTNGNANTTTTTFVTVAVDRSPLTATANQGNFGVIQYVQGGTTLWSTTTTTSSDNNEPPAVNEEWVHFLQGAVFLQDAALLNVLLEATDMLLLTDDNAITDVRAFVKDFTNNDTPTDDDDTKGDDDNNNNLEIIIIIAIVVACLAFGLLIFAVFWAWRADKRRQEAFRTSANRPEHGTSDDNDDVEQPPPARLSSKKQRSNASHTTGTKTTSQQQPPPPVAAEPSPTTSSAPPSEIDPETDAAASVLSEDISTSLTAYYQSGMGGSQAAAAYQASKQQQQQQYGYPVQQQHQQQPHATSNSFNDNASYLSMDSYGYSLDGYAPSLSGPPPQAGYPVEMMNAQEMQDLQNVVDSIMQDDNHQVTL